MRWSRPPDVLVWGRAGTPGCADHILFNIQISGVFIYLFIYLFIDYNFKRFYLFIRGTQREAETEAEGEAGSLQGAQCRT